MEKELFLKVSKNRYFDNKDLSPLDMLILSQIEEFERNEKSCYMTDEVFASNLNSSISTINRAIKSLTERHFINKTTKNVNVEGKVKTIRQLSIIKKDMTNQNDNTSNEIVANQIKNVTCQNDELLTCQNDSQKDNYLLKDKLKENKKDNTIANQNEKDKFTSESYCLPKIETEEIVLTYTPRKSLVSTMLGE